MGHNFGMSHDFDPKHGGDNGPCNGLGIMSYGDAPSKWSSCSVSDFTGYYNANNWGTTCLKGKQLCHKHFKFSCISVHINLLSFLIAFLIYVCFYQIGMPTVEMPAPVDHAQFLTPISVTTTLGMEVAMGNTSTTLIRTVRKHVAFALRVEAENGGRS